jgi:Adenylate and Guanylate cyclase catalytic domain
MLPLLSSSADLFKETTILFADLAGFTAWSSEREPTQVFTLLEAIYKDMDRAAKKLSVFKVETVSDYSLFVSSKVDTPSHCRIPFVQYRSATVMLPQQVSQSIKKIMSRL